MIQPPPEVDNESVVTAEQWQNLASYIHEVMWVRPYTYVVNVASQSSSRSLTTLSTSDTATQPTLDAQGRSYIGAATGRGYASNSPITFGLSGTCSTAIAQEARVDTFLFQSTEPVPIMPTSKTFYMLQARTAGCYTMFLGRPS